MLMSKKTRLRAAGLDSSVAIFELGELRCCWVCTQITAWCKLAVEEAQQIRLIRTETKRSSSVRTG